MKGYQIAIYIRLSKEDDKERDESNSITMQRILLQKFVAESFSDYELHEFCDDGYTGTNLERPGLRRLLALVRDFKIHCIVVKDFSRFARDYIELGTYLEQIFPFMGVRFISVNDNYDSKNYPGSIADMGVNFKNLLYDLYSKDLSQKVRSSLAIKKERGQYVSPNPPFGYERDPENRYVLRIAEDEAAVVRRIYALAGEGYTSAEIARLFNEAGVRTPIEFKLAKGKTTRVPKGERFLWSSSSVSQILGKESYIGSIVQTVPQRQLFEKRQQGQKRNSVYQPAHPLVGTVVCGCCKRNLRYRRGLNPYFTCQYRYTNAMESCVDKVNAMLLEQYVLFMMRQKKAVLSKEMIDDYIERIVVYDEQNIEICWKDFAIT